MTQTENEFDSPDVDVESLCGSGEVVVVSPAFVSSVVVVVVVSSPEQMKTTQLNK